MSLRPLDQNTSFFPAAYPKCIPRTFIAFYHTCQREIRILYTAHHYKCSVSHKSCKITHLEIFTNTGNVVAATMMKRNNGILKFTNRTRRHSKINAIIHARRIKGCCSAAGIAHSRPAPKYVRNRKNVCVRLCSIEACFSHPFETCDDETRNVIRPDGSKANFITDLRDWGKICDRMYIWDYTTCFAHYPTPHPNWRVLQPNIQAMVNNNVRGIFEQANGASRGGVDFNELRLYLISKLLWDPWCNIERHKREFMEYFYGDAAPALMEYLDLVCDTVEKENIHVGFNDAPVHGFLREELLDQYDKLFDRAAEAVKGDPIRLWRVEKNRLSILYVRIKRASMLYGQHDPETINQFVSDWRAYGLSRLEEWANIETSHRALVEGRWQGVGYFAHWTGEEQELF